MAWTDLVLFTKSRAKIWEYINALIGNTEYNKAGGEGSSVVWNSIKGLEISNNSDIPNTSIIVQPGQITDDTNTKYLELGSTIYGDLGSTFVKGYGESGVGNAVGKLDTGTIAAYTFYYPWIIEEDSSNDIDVLISASASSPTMPGGWTAKGLTGDVVLIDGSANILPFIFVEKNKIKYKTNILDFQSTIGTSRSAQTVSVPPGYEGLFYTEVYNAGSAYFIIQELSKIDIAPSISNRTHRTSTSGVLSNQFMTIQVDGSSQIGLRASAAASSGSIYTQGFINPKR